MKFNTSLLLTITLLCLSASSAPARADDGAVTTLRVPDGGLFPQAQVDARRRLHLIYFKGDASAGDIYYVRSDDGGKTWTPAIRVNSQANSAIVIGTIRGPQLALGRDGRAHVAWMGSTKAEPKVQEKFAPMLYSRMNDAGDGFEPQRNLIGGHPGLDGGGSVAADETGDVYVAWHAPEGADRSEAARQVWLVRSRDDGKTFDAERSIAPIGLGACGCCGMKIFAEGSRVGVIFRSAHEQVNRDIQVLLSEDRGEKFKVLLVHPWEVGACVMSTAALCPSGRDMLGAWETKERVYFAEIRGDQISPPAAASADGKRQKYPAIAQNKAGERIVVWAEGTGWNKGGSIAWQVFDGNNQPLAGQSGRAEGLPVWSAPTVVVSPEDRFTVIY